MKEFTIEIETELLDKVRVIAAREGRSLEEQICFLVRQYLNDPKRKMLLDSLQQHTKAKASDCE